MTDKASGKKIRVPRYTKEELDEMLYDADLECEHKLDPNKYSGIKCLHCSGWFCF